MVNRIGWMFRLLVLLGFAMGLAMMIGGRDMGQQRAGLQPRPEREPRRVVPMPPAEIAPSTAPVAEAPAPVEPPVTLTGLAERSAPGVPAFAAALPVAEPANDAPDEPPALPLRWVSADAINVRGGPSTSDPVIGRLTRNEAVSVVGEAAEGWLRIRVEGDGVEGFVASRLLTDQPPR